MNYILKNNEITVTLSDLGAEVVSVQCAGGCEYIWQGNPQYWAGRAPLLFPICGRLVNGHYTYNGNSYEMGNHGFARRTVFAGELVDDSTVRFTLSATHETKNVYPFEFDLLVEYRLCGNCLSSRITIHNPASTVLPATIGLHPGFNVPLGDESESSFEDWYVEFGKACSPDFLELSDTCFMTGRRKAFALEEGRILRLRHNLFDHDAIFLSRADTSITLRSDKSSRYVKFSFPEFPYVGFWHKPCTDAPYLCIEPWFGQPSFDGVVDDFGEKSDMFRIQPHGEQTVSYSIIFG